MFCFEMLFNNVQKYIFGGVNFLVCVFKSVGGILLFFKYVEGVYVLDEDDKCYVDYVGFWGLMIFGYSYLDVFDVVCW